MWILSNNLSIPFYTMKYEKIAELKPLVKSQKRDGQLFS